MWLKWFPWRYAVSRVARATGFMDPVALLARVHRFAQPSEVTVPVELLRAGVVFHSRGLINSLAVQHNLDWVWPFWIERQFNPRDRAFVPRAFSVTHVNLTHRNWTAVGLPDIDWYPLVDPRGLVTPHSDGWSLDFWIIPDEGRLLVPSRCDQARQRLLTDDRLAVETDLFDAQATLRSLVQVTRADGEPTCRIDIEARHQCDGFLAIAFRPANPEGISFIQQIDWQSPGSWMVNANHFVTMSREPDRICMSDYRRGDVFRDAQSDVATDVPRKRVDCDVGLATAAALYRMTAAQPLQLTIQVPHAGMDTVSKVRPAAVSSHMSGDTWQQWRSVGCKLQTPNHQFDQLFDAAVHSLLLHSSVDVFPGPYTYKRFWFRDAAFILHALLVLGHIDRVKRLLTPFAARQTRFGYFRSQEGEWDSNGEVLWIIDRFRRLGRETLSDELVEAVRKGARWIRRKRLAETLGTPTAGLLPAGFSAEHLGPNDNYYWDDFWSVAGLRAAADILQEAGQDSTSNQSAREAHALSQCIDRSIEQTASQRDQPGVPASPHRRMDSGAIGSLAAGYPLQLWDARDQRLLDTVEFLLDRCTFDGGFFQDMTHSGINAYLTLHLAQVLLRAGDDRWLDLVQTVADLASPTGQWPEAIHPGTHGGCMGDGQHVWASAEWVMMIRNCFVREEGDRLVLCGGLPPAWFESDQVIRFGPTPTPYGSITIEVNPRKKTAVTWHGQWYGRPPRIEVAHPYMAGTASASG